MSAAPTSRTIMLIGPRGCGKTTVGAALALQLSRRFVDLDDLTRQRLGGTSVAEAWSRHGEAGWRRAEAEALADVLRETGLVVALGGGTPTVESARRTIRDQQADGSAVVVYLCCPVEELRKRLRQGAGDRPSLTDLDPVDEVERVLASREATYRAVADVVVDAGPGTVARTVDAVAAALASWGGAIEGTGIKNPAW